MAFPDLFFETTNLTVCPGTVPLTTAIPSSPQSTFPLLGNVSPTTFPVYSTPFFIYIILHNPPFFTDNGLLSFL